MSKVVPFPGRQSRSSQATYPPPGAAEMVTRLNNQLEELRMAMDSVRDHCSEDMWRRMEASCAYLDGAIILLSNAFKSERQAEVVTRSRQATSLD